MSFGHWETMRDRRSRLSAAGTSALRMVLLFGTVAVALALIAAPMIEVRMKDYLAQAEILPQLDTTTTGSITYKGSYTIRKSVLQDSPNSICILRDNGTRSGDC